MSAKSQPSELMAGCEGMELKIKRERGAHSDDSGPRPEATHSESSKSSADCSGQWWREITAQPQRQLSSAVHRAPFAFSPMLTRHPDSGSTAQR